MWFTQLVQFLLSDFWVFVGACLLIGAIGDGVSKIVRASKGLPEPKEEEEKDD